MIKKIVLVLVALCALGSAQTINQSFRNTGTLTTNSGAGSTVAVASSSWGTASVTINGTYAGLTGAFEISDDGGTTWYPTTCTRTDAAIQDTAPVVATNATIAWDCAIFGTTNFRVRASAFGSGTANVGITLTVAQVETSPTVTVATGPNPCMSSGATLQSVSGATSGTASVQLVALSGTTKIYVCSMQVTSVSGTTPTFALRYGTGSACATGTVTVFGPTAALTVGQIVGPNFPFTITTAGAALCYIQTGTTPIANYTINYVQQ